MAGYRVDLGEVDQAVLMLSGLNAFCEELLSGVDGAAATALDHWSGEAASRFQELHALWIHGGSRMAAGVAEMRTAAADARGNYDLAGSHCTGVWS